MTQAIWNAVVKQEPCVDPPGRGAEVNGRAQEIIDF